VPLTLVTGRANAGKTGIIYGALRRAREDGRRPVLLLPTRPDVVRARAELGGEGAVGLEIEQFDRYLESLWDLLGDGRVIVSHVERDVLLRRALSDRARRELEVSGNGRGLRRVLSQLIERRAETGGASPARATGPGSAVVEVLGEYERLLAERGRIEREEAFRLLARSEGAGLSDPLIVHRFSDLSSSQERFVVAASGTGAEVWVSLPWEPGLPAATAVEPLASRLAAVGMAGPASSGSFTAVPELARLASGLFARPEPVGSEGAVDLIVAQGPGAEAEAIARAVSEHLAAGVRPEEVAVAFRDAGRHVREVRRAFERAGIEADYDVRTPAAEWPFGRALLHLWTFVAKGMSRVDLVAFMRTPFSGADPDVVDEMDVRWRRDRVECGESLLRGLASCPVALSRVRLARSLVDRQVEGEAIERWRALADGLLASAYPGDAPLLHSDAALDARVHGSLLSAVSDLAGLRGEASSEDVMDSVREGLVAPGAVERPGRVQVTSVERLRSRRFEAVVLGGLTASEFPRGEAEDASASEALSGAYGLMGLAPRARPAAARERLLYYEAVTRARRRLTLVRQESDDEGADVAPSVFWDETLDLYRDPLAGPEQPGLPRLRRVTAADLAETAPRATRPPRSAPQGAIADAGVRARVARAVFSVSDIETYLTCPYRWFHSRVVAPGTLDLEIDARTRGTLAHDALARFYRSIHSELGVERVTPGTIAEALELAERVTGEVLARAPRPGSLAEEMALATIGPLVSRLVSRDATFLPGWRPVEVEWAFGMDDEPHDFGSFLLRGRVDRIDDGPAGLVIVDYKTGSSSVTPQAKMLSGGKVQMPLYSAAASARLGRPVAGGLYRSLSKHLDRGFVSHEASDGAFTRTDVVQPGEIDELIDGAVALAGEAVEGMRAGRIAPTPSPEACGPCMAAGFCGPAMR
jgi:ATP-dependent helicase/nuclease subunit B